VAEFRRISQHDRGLMADGVISVMGVAMMMAAIAVKMVVMVVGVAFIVAMDMRMVTSAMAMIERGRQTEETVAGSKPERTRNWVSILDRRLDLSKTGRLAHFGDYRIFGSMIFQSWSASS
jgi:hypothetical protein